MPCRYSLATKAYLAKGHDGYESFKGCPVLLDAECAPMLPTAVRCHLLLLAVLNKWVSHEFTHHELDCK